LPIVVFYAFELHKSYEIDSIKLVCYFPLVSSNIQLFMPREGIYA
jgi:hypothetical protein